MMIMKQIDIVSVTQGGALLLRRPYRKAGAAHLMIEKGNEALTVELTHAQARILAQKLQKLGAVESTGYGEGGVEPRPVLGSELVSRATKIRTELKGLADAYRMMSPKSMFPEGTKLIEEKIAELQTCLAELENTHYVPQHEEESVDNG